MPKKLSNHIWKYFYGICYQDRYVKHTEGRDLETVLSTVVITPDVITPLTAICQIPESRVLKIQIVTLGHEDHYVALKVEIINSLTTGLIDRQIFKFENYLTTEDRVDDRVTGEHKYATEWHIWKDRQEELDWYICRPDMDSMSGIIGAINDYIKTFEINVFH